MSGETNLARLLATMQPELQAGEYVFCTAGADVAVADALGWFREAEGASVILPRAVADAHGFPYSYVAAWLTLTVHSSLEAVGLTAAVATALARKGISCNVVAAYHHDHLFVLQADAERALQGLHELSATVA